MTATDDAPDLLTAEARWQHLIDRITDLEARITATTSTVNTALDTHLARLDALHRHLTQRPWPPAATPDQTAGRPTEQPGRPTGPETPQHATPGDPRTDECLRTPGP